MKTSSVSKASESKTGLEGYIRLGVLEDFAPDCGSCVLVEGQQIAIFNFDRKEWYAVQNQCPHEKQMVLARGILGDAKGEPKVACPLHKNTFSLCDGRHLGGNPEFQLKVWDVKVVEGVVYLSSSPSNKG